MGMRGRALVASIIEHILVLSVRHLSFAPAVDALHRAEVGGVRMDLPPVFIPSALMEQLLDGADRRSVFAIPEEHGDLHRLFLVGDILSSSLIAYAFARLYSRWSGPLFLLVLATLMIPYQVLMIPQFILFKQLGWLNTYLPLIVPTYFGQLFLIFLLRQFFRGIPRDFDDAAKVDGASHLVIFWRIILPLSKPALASVAIFSFMFHWNDYLGPLIYLNSNDLYPTSLGLAQYTANYGATEWNYLMAASLVTLLPCLVVFFIGQRYFVQGITLSGVKG